MKRFSLNLLASLLSLLFVFELLGQDFSGGKMRVLSKKARTQEFKEIVSSHHPPLSSGEDDKGVLSSIRPQAGYGEQDLSHTDFRIKEIFGSHHTLSYRYLFLPPPA
ncbi:hypothetical protein EHO61_06135 [Leptospira fluminis]|uniref:Uncharacterized protein n=1 Tax=Leptospira fluminis TaxID=2484979 RepID=A0A4R9GSN0_9LEPT|nr:hypothetical protein [Leptospira fluminis]TGK20083.1 hypothetical protein EHO61_06135 [Leptospira fluminis]